MEIRWKHINGFNGLMLKTESFSTAMRIMNWFSLHGTYLYYTPDDYSQFWEEWKRAGGSFAYIIIREGHPPTFIREYSMAYNQLKSILITEKELERNIELEFEKALDKLNQTLQS